uniref:Mitochondrial resolvase Ydc2 catalytic domain-containing protein n=1 Tax=viral metagenome TaxID=1070528 RepID=A0A6C0E3B7_9ZZZZ
MSSSPCTIKLLSIDIGIKNLAFCLFEIENNIYSVKKWDIVNIGEEKPLLCGEIENDKSKAKSTKSTKHPQIPHPQIPQSINICNKPAKYTKNNKCYCLKHSKKQVFHVPTKELESSYLNKQKINSLFELAEKYNISYAKPIKKQGLIHLFNEYVLNKCFEPVNITNSNKVDIISIGKNIKKKFDEIFITNNTYDNIDVILIENQISPIANRMKTIQGMVAQYFIMKSSTSHQQDIKFVSSFNKLKDVTNKTTSITHTQDDKTEKSKYNDRKKLGIVTCLENLEKIHDNNEWISFFAKHSKRDDLADCFLQGIWYIKNKL